MVGQGVIGITIHGPARLVVIGAVKEMTFEKERF